MHISLLKGKFVAMKELERMEVELHQSFTRHQMELCGHLKVPASLSSWMVPPVTKEQMLMNP